MEVEKAQVVGKNLLTDYQRLRWMWKLCNLMKTAWRLINHRNPLKNLHRNNLRNVAERNLCLRMTKVEKVQEKRKPSLMKTTKQPVRPTNIQRPSELSGLSLLMEAASLSLRELEEKNKSRKVSCDQTSQR
ncbi:uncharacterized protein LOC127848087 [Dreissena polymorpha]|uniref:uncharacterized protein LOC127848087 n=1 Tax=Dreissena polymorpha TaxID=45954 RepID=UPI00226528C8|nr:uncharacterized protein LOC127848087 [Dreissena polymorpha]